MACELKQAHGNLAAATRKLKHVQSQLIYKDDVIKAMSIELHKCVNGRMDESAIRQVLQSVGR